MAKICQKPPLDGSEESRFTLPVALEVHTVHLIKGHRLHYDALCTPYILSTSMEGSTSKSVTPMLSFPNSDGNGCSIFCFLKNSSMKYEIFYQIFFISELKQQLPRFCLLLLLVSSLPSSGKKKDCCKKAKTRQAQCQRTKKIFFIYWKFL